MPSIRAHAHVARSLLAELPIWIALELHNRGDAWSGRLAPLDLRDPPGGWALRLRRDEELVAEVSAAPAPGEIHGAPPGFVLFPGERRRELLDLTELLGPLAAGEYRLLARHEQAAAEVELALEIAPLEEFELEPVRELQSPEGWMEALVWSDVEPEAIEQLPLRCRDALRFHVWLAAAVRAPTVAHAPRDGLFDLPEPLAGEAFAFEYEIAVARDEPNVLQARDELVTRWPGLSWRAEDVHAGLGALTLLQELHQLRRG